MRKWIVILIFVCLCMIGSIYMGLQLLIKERFSGIIDWSKEAFDEIQQAEIYEIELLRITDSKANDRCPTFSPDGKWIAYFSDDLLTIITPKGEEKLKIQNKRLGLPLSPYRIEWAPDGKKLLSSYYLNCNFKSLIFDVSTSKMEILDDFIYGDWSPNGELIVGYDKKHHRIAFYDINSGGFKEDGLNLEEIAGSNELEPNPVQPLTWSSNGKIYWFLRFKNLVTKLIELDPETLEYRILVDNDLLNEGLSVSPDGNSLFFSASHLFRKKDPPIPTTQLILYDLTQNKMRKLSSIGFGLSWSPDSKKILYNSILPLPPKLFIKEMNTKRTYIIKNIEVVASGADWSPDGRKIVLAIPQEEAVKLVVFRPP